MLRGQAAEANEINPTIYHAADTLSGKGGSYTRRFYDLRCGHVLTAAVRRNIPDNA